MSYTYIWLNVSLHCIETLYKKKRKGLHNIRLQPSACPLLLSPLLFWLQFPLLSAKWGDPVTADAGHDQY